MRLLLILALVLPATPLAAQLPTTPEAEVEAAIHALFDAMRSGDGDAAGALFHPEARLQSVASGAAGVTLRTSDAADFVAAIGAPRDEVWDEQISGLEIRVDGGLATAWMNYRFYRGDTFSHCGVNAVQLFNGADGWQIIQVADTRATSGCDERG